MKKGQDQMLKLSRASQREVAKTEGFFDGRFRPRVVTSKKHKGVKHKKSQFDSF